MAKVNNDEQIKGPRQTLHYQHQQVGATWEHSPSHAVHCFPGFEKLTPKVGNSECNSHLPHPRKLQIRIYSFWKAIFKIRICYFLRGKKKKVQVPPPSSESWWKEMQKQISKKHWKFSTSLMCSSINIMGDVENSTRQSFIGSYNFWAGRDLDEMDQCFVWNEDALKRPAEWKVGRLEHCWLGKSLQISHKNDLLKFYWKKYW